MNLRRLFKSKKLKPKLEYGFRDLKGRAYYRVPSQMAMPIEMFGMLQDNLMWQSAGMTAIELKGLIDAGELEMENLVQGKKGSLATVGYVLSEMKMRSEMVIHTELLYRFLAIQYIREDEDVENYNDSLIEDKVLAFKELVKKKGAYSTFQVPELERVNQQLNLSHQEWEELWTASIKEQERLKKKLEILKSGIESAKEKRTSIIS